MASIGQWERQTQKRYCHDDSGVWAMENDPACKGLWVLCERKWDW